MDKVLADRVKAVVNSDATIRLSPAVLEAVTAWEAFALAEQRGRVPGVVRRELADRMCGAECRMTEEEHCWWNAYVCR